MIINKNDIQEMILNNDNFEVKMTIEIDSKKCKNVFMTYKNNKIDFTVDEWSNDEEIVSKVERLINYNKHYDLLNIIEHCTDIELLKNNDKIMIDVNNYIDSKQYNYYDSLMIREKLIEDYSSIMMSCIRSNNYILKEDVSERIDLLNEEFEKDCTELNNYYIDNFNNEKKYNSNSIRHFIRNENNRFLEIKNLLK